MVTEQISTFCLSHGTSGGAARGQEQKGDSRRLIQTVQAVQAARGQEQKGANSKARNSKAKNSKARNSKARRFSGG